MKGEGIEEKGRGQSQVFCAQRMPLVTLYPTGTRQPPKQIKQESNRIRFVFRKMALPAVWG